MVEVQRIFCECVCVCVRTQYETEGERERAKSQRLVYCLLHLKRIVTKS